MQTVKLFLGILFLSIMSFSAIASVPHSSVMPAATSDGAPITSKKQQQLMLIKWFSNLSPKEYGQMSGKKLNFFERLSFKATQHRMKQQLKKAAASSSESEGVNWGGFALGFFLGLLGVLGAYIFSDDKNFRKWTWIGCGIWIVLAIIIFI